MIALHAWQPARVLILKADKFYADALRRVTRSVFPRAEFVMANRVSIAAAELLRSPVDLFLTGIEMTDGDVFELLEACTATPRDGFRVLVVTGRREPQVLSSLAELPIHGVFDAATEEPEQFENVLRGLGGSVPYWSTSLLARLSHGDMRSAICASLTPTERLVFAVIGDGCDDTAAAGRLGMAASTIQTIRREIHRKLGVQHKGELVRVAAQYGFVWLTSEGVIRPGFSLLQAARESRRVRRSSGGMDSRAAG
jgi:DNA-binding NarL/FixJ family response regulator